MEVVISSNKKHNESKVESFKKSKINTYFGCGTSPWIAARFFPFNNAFEETPFLQKIAVLTKSDVNGEKFVVRFYAVDKNNKPGEYLCNQPIFGYAKKGK